MEINNLLSNFYFSVNNFPNNIAAKDKSRSITFSELNDESNLIASHLINIKKNKNLRVGICLNRSVDYLTSILGILKAGSAFVPLTPDIPDKRLISMLEIAQVDLVIVNNSNIKLNNFETVTLNKIKEKPTLKNEKVEISSLEDLAYIIFTSGSSGIPKGVQISHLNLITFCNSIEALKIFSRETITLGLTNFTFDISILEIMTSIFFGGKVYIASEDERLDVSLINQIIFKNNINFIQATPTFFSLLIKNEIELPANIMFFCGGEKLSNDLAGKLNRLSNNIYNVYGPTEATIWATIKKLSANDLNISIGNALPNYKIKIIDEKMEEVSSNDVGEIILGGKSISPGYIGSSIEKNDAFISYKNEYFYRTGDLGFWENDEIIYLKRKDNQIKFAGQRLELDELKNIVLRMENIFDAEALFLDISNQSNDFKLIIIYASKDGLEISNLDFFHYLKKEFNVNIIPDFFIYQKSLPINNSGKRDLEKCKSISLDRISQVKSLETNELKKIWASVLGYDNFNIDLSFFEIGGNSIKGLDLILKSNQFLKMKLSIAYLYENNTFRAYCRGIMPGLNLDLIPTNENFLIDSVEDELKPKNRMKSNWIMFLFLVLFLEVIFRVFPIGSYLKLNHLKESEVDNYLLSKNDSSYSKYFCDINHKSFKGQALSLACILESNYFTNSIYKKVWIYGSSDFGDQECEDGKGVFAGLKALNPKIQIDNFSWGGTNSDYGIKLISNELTKKNNADLVLWGYWGATEMYFLEDKRDLNFEVLKNKYNTNSINFEKIQETLVLNYLNLEANVFNFLIKNSYFFNAFSATFHTSSNKYEEYSKFFFKINSELDSDQPSPRDLEFLRDSLINGADRFVLKSKGLQYALDNYELNLSKLQKISIENNLKIVCINQPYLSNYLKPLYPKLNEYSENWHRTFSVKSKELCQKYGFDVIDVQSCFKEKVEKDKK